MSYVAKHNVLTDVDPRLLEQAFHRARGLERNKDIDSASLLSAIIAEARRGTRHMYGLVNAASQPASNAG